MRSTDPTVAERENRAPTLQERPWHAMGAGEVLEALQARESGLSEDEARRRLESHGPNKLPEEQRRGPWRRFLAQFQNMLIIILLVAAVFMGVLQEWVDMGVIVAVVLVNGIIGFIQEGKAEKALEAIRGMLSPRALVLRDGEEKELPAEDVVPGDVVLLGSGDRVPADLRVFRSRNAQVEEAALTGESEPVDKTVEAVEEDVPLGDRTCMAYSSTVITTGRLRGVVVATGAAAEIGRISEMVGKVQKISTPLLRKIDAFGRKLSVAIVVLAGLVFLFGYFFRQFMASDMFMAVVSLAVAAIPEGLPAIMTITLALGVQRMARRRAIIRRLPAVETLGSVTVICSDKTGTLTRNEMTVVDVVLAARRYRVEGVGYAPEGRFKLSDPGEADEELTPEDDPLILELARAGLLASDARLKRNGEQWSIQGAPTEGSVVVLAAKAGLERGSVAEANPRKDVIPFESERQFMATLDEGPRGGATLHVKGAPEKILSMCVRQRTAPGEAADLDRDWWEARERELASDGRRVLAVAIRKSDDLSSLHPDSPELQELTMLGLVGIIDPPREEAIAAIDNCRDAGIKVKMITGDHILTARSIAASMGIGDGERAVSGRHLEQASPEEMLELVEKNDVFARSSPEHKLRIMEALQAQGQVVAMTGDGVNDAPALKRADVGVAMGIKGSEASKEAADMVLADDNFATIERAVEEGRTIYDNLVKTILFMLPTNGAEALLIIVSVLFLFDVIPVLPVQILWVNMVTAVTLALALAFEPAEKGIMQRPPRPPDEPIISGYLVWRIIFVSLVIGVLTMLLFEWALQVGAPTRVARTLAVNTLVAGQLFYLFNARRLFSSSISLDGLFGNRKALLAVGVLVLLQLGFTYLGVFHTLFRTGPMPAYMWGWVVGAGLVVFLVVEAEKAILSRGRKGG